VRRWAVGIQKGDPLLNTTCHWGGFRRRRRRRRPRPRRWRWRRRWRRQRRRWQSVTQRVCLIGLGRTSKRADSQLGYMHPRVVRVAG